MPALVVIHRRAGQAEITHTVRNDDGVSIECTLDDFMRHMAEQMLSAPVVGTRKAFIEKMLASAEQSIELLKSSSVHNPPPKERS